MNNENKLQSKPHIRGDEPGYTHDKGIFVNVSPTYVGMNRKYGVTAAKQAGKPHIRGDEPNSTYD